MKFRITQLAALAICAVTSLGAMAADAPARTPFPSLSLAEAHTSGQRAIDVLGKRLPEVAAFYGSTPEALRQRLLTDKTLRLDGQGRLYVVEEMDRPLPPAPEDAASSQATGQALAPLDQTFLLHSRPGAKRTIYLDFNGAVLQNTAWNGSNPTINALPFDSDGNSAVLSDAELERIQYIWQRVAEDYAPFDVDVTTEQPSPDRLSRNGLSDDIFGTTVLITNNVGVYNCSCGGVAYLRAFDDTNDFYKPALVFWNMLGSGNEKYVAEAISHEAGHNLGLNHDGYSAGGYYPGHGSGDTGWAPIMGVGYYQPVVQWSRGEYSTANNLEDDFTVIATYGAPLRPDDHGNNPASATALTATPSGSVTALSGAGVISTRKDKDAFKFNAKAGAASFTISPDSRSANLDVSVKLQNASGTVLVKSKPAATLGTSFNVNLPAAGTYYLIVDGVGVANPLSDGYSDYGSVGQYTISGSVPTP